MFETIFVECEELISELDYFDCPIMLQARCEEVGLTFKQDEYHRCYVSRDSGCKVFKKFYLFEEE